MKKWSAVFAFLLLLCTVVGCSHTAVTVDMDAVQISMIFFTIDRPGFDHQAFPAAMREKGILINGLEDGKYRFVTHYWVGKKEIDRVADTLAQILA